LEALPFDDEEDGDGLLLLRGAVAARNWKSGATKGGADPLGDGSVGAGGGGISERQYGWYSAAVVAVCRADQRSSGVPTVSVDAHAAAAAPAAEMRPWQVAASLDRKRVRIIFLFVSFLLYSAT